MSLEKEIWYSKIISLESPHMFCCKNTNIEMPFDIDPVKIQNQYSLNYPKWEKEIKYHLISQRSWGLGKKLCLYVDDLGETFIIESTY